MTDEGFAEKVSQIQLPDIAQKDGYLAYIELIENREDTSIPIVVQLT